MKQQTAVRRTLADRIIELLTTCFWDLRSQCESQVRTLSAAQRLLDQYRRAAGETDRDAVLRSLRHNVDDLSTANAAINEVIAEVRRQIDIAQAGTPGKDKR
jgi:signal transduction protein with GAF and PtsI domain